MGEGGLVGGKQISFTAWILTENADVSGFPTVAHFLLVEVIVNRIETFEN